MYTLIDKDSGEPITVGRLVKTNFNEDVIVVGLRPPHKPSSQGKVIVRHKGSKFECEYYASVINGRYVESAYVGTRYFGDFL